MEVIEVNRIVVFAIFVFSFSISGRSASPACFPFETLPPELRAKSEEMLLKALDTEALYTIVGGLKPMSSGFASFKFNVANPDLTGIEQARRMLSVWRCGDEIYADIHHFARIYEGVRHAEGVIFHRSALAATIERHTGFFAPYGLTASAHPIEVLMAIEYSAQGPRWRGQGYMFGFPDAAVDFFVAAGEQQEITGRMVERDFISIPTYSSPTNRFVWAVPKGYVENESDRRLRAEAEAILSEYRTRRTRYIGPGKKGVARMLRDWFEDRRKMKRAA